MFIGKQGAFLAGATPIFTRAPETKDGDLTAEVKAAVEALGKTFEDFKTKNDERLKQVETKRGEDAVTKDEVEKINKGIDDAKAELKKRLDELEAKANRLQLGGSADGVAEAKAAQAFGELIGQKDFDAEKLVEYKGDLGNYLRRNEVKATTMMVAADPSGGFWVTPEVGGRMVKKIFESTPMRQLANVVSIGTDRLEGPIDNGEMDAAWVGETGTRSQTDAAQIGMWAIDVNELYAYPMVTQKLLEDSKIDVEGWLADKSSSKFSRKENAAFVSGDGVGKPKGFLSYTTAATDDATRAWGIFQHVMSGHATQFTADQILSLIFELKAGYRQNAGFLTARKSIGAIRKLKDGQGNYLVDLRLRDGALVESIFGFGVTDGEDMPAVAADAVPLAFGDFNEAYTIVDRLGTSVVRDNITRPGFVKYHMRRRVGGGAVNFEALKMMKIGT
ncbi:phage major capsid protein [Sphingomonas sp. MG17]|uniref:Phage major capsid protein n=1 Tax=Sphingomonas tagetis TaxID=2949092 RepID=A0A9X2HMW9_9SPHN|nr:phage major capsid protein [Sphingomonas tagetis]MCP3729260.1 phage major capsid protein [Sphingomonas tagetis]